MSVLAGGYACRVVLVGISGILQAEKEGATVSNKKIQAQFGQVVMDPLHQFPRTDIESVAPLEGDDFNYVNDVSLRAVLTRTT